MSRLSDIKDKIDRSSLRERGLIFFTLMAMLFVIWELSIQSIAIKKEQAIAAEMAAIATEQASVDVQISTLQMVSVNSLYKEKTANIEELKQAIAKVEFKLAGLSQGLISAEHLPSVLKEFFAQGSALHLLKVKTLPAEELQVQTLKSSDAAEQNTLSGSGVFKHTVIIEVSGSYAQLITLLASLESMEWKFYWESLDYQVLTYPTARISLRVFTTR